MLQSSENIPKVLAPRERAIRVHVVQPIVPHYRVPLFARLARRSELELSLSASPRIRGLPPCEKVPGLAVDLQHRYLELLGGTFIWQRSLAIDSRLAPGDVLVINGNPRFLSNYGLILEAKRRRLRIVWWGHAWSATSKPLWVRLRLRLMRLADVVLLYTDSERDELLKHQFDPGRVFALNNALDDERIGRLILSWQGEILEQFEIEQQLSGRHVLLFCGRLRQSPSTDLDVALRALASLVAENDRYLLIVIGEGPDGPRLQALAAELQITKYVRWLGEIYDEEELAPWFRASTCFVYPGSVGLSLIQALGYGLPAITHDNRLLHNPEIAALEDGANGLTFPKGDHLALAGCIRRICGETRLRLQMSRCARKTIETRYSMAGMAERFVQAVRAAANTHGSDPAGAGNEPRAAGRV